MSKNNLVTCVKGEMLLSCLLAYSINFHFCILMLCLGKTYFFLFCQIIKVRKKIVLFSGNILMYIFIRINTIQASPFLEG